MKSQPLLFAGSSHKELAQEISTISGLSLGGLLLGSFPDGEISVEIQEDVRGREVFVLQSIAIDPNRYLIELLLIIDALKRGRAASIVPIIPYFGYCRQDRKTRPGAPIAAKVVANLLAMEGIVSLITCDLHADQVEGFFEIPVEHLHCQKLLCDAAKDFFDAACCVVAPDIGGIKRAEIAAKHLDVDLAIMNKQRLSSFEVSVNLIGDVADKNVLIFDDMCSTGGTIVAAAHLLRKSGARKIAAAVSHALFVGDAMKRLEEAPLEAFFITNTIPCTVTSSSIAIKISSIAPMIAEAINSFRLPSAFMRT